MAEAGLALAAVIPEEKLVRVLVIDDEVDFQQDMTDYFETYGYGVDAAKTLEEGQALLDNNDYQIVLADVNFEDLRVKGDRFVLNNHKNFKGARVVVVTGRNINELRNRAALDNLKIPVWSKGDPNWGPKLTGLTKEASNARKQELSGQVNDFLRRTLGDSGDYVVSASTATATAMAKAEPAPAPWDLAVEDIFIGWLQSQSNLDRPFFSIGRSVFSASKMVEHVKKKTEVGKELLEMFVTEVRYSLGLKDKPIHGR